MRSFLIQLNFVMLFSDYPHYCLTKLSWLCPSS
jgi:hypothetical protein